VADDSINPLPGQPPRGESVRETIVRSIRENEAAMAHPARPSANVQALADKAVLGMCELLGLLFALPFGEDLYHGSSISGWHWFYLSIGLLFAGAGPLFPWIRTRAWIPGSASASLSRAALDARFWIAALLLIFVYMVAPEIYQRAMGVNETTATSIAPRIVSTEPSLAGRPEYLKNISFGGATMEIRRQLLKQFLQLPRIDFASTSIIHTTNLDGCKKSVLR
jgi:hypothetical protein